MPYLFDAEFALILLLFLKTGTGKVLSEMILGQPLSADVGQLVVQEAHVQAKL